MELSIIQRDAIKQMLSSFYGDYSMGEWNSCMLRYFTEYGLPISEPSLSPDTYYKVLRELPLGVKRDIIHKVFKAWIAVCNYDVFSLHDAFSKLVYLKICSGPEYFFMNAMESLIKYFGTGKMWADSYESYHYEINYVDRENSIEFDHDEGKNRLRIKISGSLINKKTPFDGQPSPSQIQPLFDAVSSQPLGSHAPWIYANARIDCRYYNYGFDKGLIEFNLTNIEYVDNNGVD